MGVVFKQTLVPLGLIEDDVTGFYLTPIGKLIIEDIDESESALKIATYVKKVGWNMQANQELRRHTQKFCWISMWGVTDKPLTSKYFRDEIDTLVDNIENPLLEIEKLKKEHSRRKEIFDKTLKKLNASEHLEGLARILQSYVFLRTITSDYFLL